MARLWHSGAESNSTTLEGTTIVGSPTIDSTVKRNGSYSFKTAAAGSAQYFKYQFKTGNTTARFFYRIYFRIASLPSAEDKVFWCDNTQTNGVIGMRLETNGVLRLYNECPAVLTQIGSDSSALSTNTWYRLELDVDTTTAASTVVNAYLATGDGAATLFASGTTDTSTQGGNQAIFGWGSRNNVTATYNIDDVGVNDTTVTSITAANLTSGVQATSATSANTASISPGANKLDVVFVAWKRTGANVDIPTVSGAGGTWVEINHFTNNDGASIRGVAMFRDISASPGSGALTITFSEAKDNFGWSVDEFTGTDISGTHGSGAIVQDTENSQNGTFTGFTLTLSALGSANNVAYGGIRQGGTGAVTKGGSFTELSNNTNGNIWEAEWAINQTAVNWTWASTTQVSIAMAIEIKAAKKQSGLLGAGQITHLQPNATGDSNQFTIQVGGTAGAANNWTRVSEVTPDDATSYNSDLVLNNTDEFKLTATPSSIASGDTINVVAVGVRFSGALASGDATFALRIKKVSGGTVLKGSNLTPGATAWKTNKVVTPPANFSLVTYQDPDSGTWTKSTLDTSQIGYDIQTGNTNAAKISTVWMSIDSTPAVVASTFLPRLMLLGTG